jgi:glc operon protein GlcG
MEAQMPERHEIAYADARTVVDAVVEKLVAQGAGAAVAVTDPHGELIAFARTDGCPLASINNAINKAFTAARERVESAIIGQRSRDEGFPMTNFGDIRYTAWGGGVPIIRGGRTIGAVGLSGLPEAEDIVLARMGAELVSD